MNSLVDKDCQHGIWEGKGCAKCRAIKLLGERIATAIAQYIEDKKEG